MAVNTKDLLYKINEVTNITNARFKLSEDGFVLRDEKYPKFSGVIKKIELAWRLWDGQRYQMFPYQSSKPPVEGAKLSAEITIEINGRLFYLNVSQFTIKCHLHPYLESLTDQGLEYDQVPTGFIAGMEEIGDKKFAIVRFVLVRSKNPAEPETPGS